MISRVALEGLEFKAYHGVYDFERQAGNTFEVDIAVNADFSGISQQDDIHNTVDYEQLYQIVKGEMEMPSHLLETVAEKIVNKVLANIAAVQLVEVKISKLNPPIGGSCRRAVITLSKSRS
jgi:dihydroneopterin aldolase